MTLNHSVKKVFPVQFSFEPLVIKKKASVWGTVLLTHLQYSLSLFQTKRKVALGSEP